MPLIKNNPSLSGELISEIIFPAKKRSSTIFQFQDYKELQNPESSSGESSMSSVLELSDNSKNSQKNVAVVEYKYSNPIESSSFKVLKIIRSH